MAESSTTEYKAYYSARYRCTNPKDPRWHRYGGRGIGFRFTSYEQFLACLGRKPAPNLSLDRIENDGHYEPGNVRWATKEQQISTRLHPRKKKPQSPRPTNVAIFVRHSTDCEFKADSFYKTCSCTKHVRWSAGKRQFRKSADTSNWFVAEQVAQQIRINLGIKLPVRSVREEAANAESA
jgi:hypothetical protein